MLKSLGRLLLAGIFISGGMDQLQQPDGRVQKAQEAGIPNARQAVMINGTTMVVGGAALALGLLPRLAAAALAATLVPTTLVGHAFWKEQDPATRKSQQIHFLKNLAILGGLLFAATTRDKG